MRAKYIMFVLLAGMVLLLGCSKVVESASSGEKAAGFSLQDINDKTVRLSDYANHLVILNFFATWCPPCRSEIPDFIELMDEYGDKNFVIIGIALDRDQDVVRDFAIGQNIDYPVLFDDGFTADSYGPIGSIPTTFIIDKKGNIVQKIVGARDKDFFEKIIKSYL